MFHGRMFASRTTRLLLAAVLAVGAFGYVAVRLGRSAAPAVAATTPPTIVIPVNAMSRGFTTKRLTIHKGQNVHVVNKDSIAHTVTSDAKKGNAALFTSYLRPHSSATLATSKLAPGKYKFHCNIHPSMRGLLIVKGSGGGTAGSVQTFTLPLRIPPVITSANPTIPVERAGVQVFPHGPKTMMWTYGGSYPGPTIRRPSGSTTAVTFDDHLTAAGDLSVHLHGDHHASVDDGQPDTDLLVPGKSRTYTYPLTYDDGKPVPSAFLYYHDHRMMETGRNNWMGLQGMFVVDNAADRKYGLPTGRYDVPVMVSDRSFTKDNQLTNPFPKDPMSALMGAHKPPNDATVGTTVLVNGEYSPHFDVATHRYRLRILNASNFQSYDFELSDGQSFTQIGSGDSLFPKPVVRKDILLGPSQRADVVVNFAGQFGKRIVLQSVPRVSGPADGIGSATAKLMQFRVTKKVGDSSHVPSTLLTLPPMPTADESFMWTINDPASVGGHEHWEINGAPFDPSHSDVTVTLGSTALWTIKNDSTMTHYFHIHEEQWRTISRNGKPPAPWERGLQDTWRLDPGDTVVVEGTFTDYTGTFMVHCHMLDHEDHGLMAQFTVAPPAPQRSSSHARRR